jgi:hypothetical protein
MRMQLNFDLAQARKRADQLPVKPYAPVEA